MQKKDLLVMLSTCALAMDDFNIWRAAGGTDAAGKEFDNY